jgi:hypothetical protein
MGQASGAATGIASSRMNCRADAQAIVNLVAFKWEIAKQQPCLE